MPRRATPSTTTTAVTATPPLIPAWTNSARLVAAVSSLPICPPIDTAFSDTSHARSVAAAVGHVDGPFAVLNGDNVYDEANIAELFDRVPAVGYTRVETPGEYGVISTDGGFVTGIVEKPDDPQSNLANTGAYAFPESARDLLDVPTSERGERELTDVLRRLIGGDDVAGVAFDAWADIGYPWDLLEANERALETVEREVAGEVHPDATL
jgi:dTDP-glucose pyrophosphorylase